MDFSEITQRALEIRAAYNGFETARYGRAWNKEEIAMGFVGDVGDLIKLVMAESGIREISSSREKLGHELADCLWSLIVLANEYGIDLEKEFSRTMKELETQIRERNGLSSK